MIPMDQTGGSPPKGPSDGRSPERTGDRAIDEAIQALERAALGTLDEQLAAAEQVHRTLQSRLADLRTD